MLVTRMIQPKRADKGTIISLYTEHYKKYPPPVGRAERLLYFLLQRVKYLRAEKSPKVISRPSSEFFHQIDGYLLTVGVKHTIHAGRGHARAVRKFIGTNATFFAQIAEPLGHGFLDGHKNHLKKEHRKKYAFACTHLRIFGKKGIMGKKIRTCVK